MQPTVSTSTRKNNVIPIILTTLLLIAPISAVILVPYAWLYVFPVSVALLLVGALSMAILSKRSTDSKRVWKIAVSAGTISTAYYLILGTLVSNRTYAPIDIGNIFILAILIIPTLFIVANSIAVLLTMHTKTTSKQF